MDQLTDTFLIIADDHPEPAVMLGPHLDAATGPGFEWQWCETLAEVHEILDAPPAGKTIAVLLDSHMAMLNMRDKTREALAAHSSELPRFLDEPVLSGLLFSTVIRRHLPDARILMHSAFGEPIQLLLSNNAELGELGTKMVDAWVWKPASVQDVVEAIGSDAPG